MWQPSVCSIQLSAVQMSVELASHVRLAKVVSIPLTQGKVSRFITRAPLCLPRHVGTVALACILVSPAWSQETDAKTQAKEWVESGLDHFLSTCAEALQDRDSYVAGLGQREGMVAHGLSDDQKVRAVRYQPFEPGSRSGWIEQSLFSEDEGTTRTTCVVAGFNTAFPTTEEIDAIFTEWLAEKLPGATMVGGILSAAPGASFDAGPAVPSVS